MAADMLDSITKKFFIPRAIDNIYDTNMLLKRFKAGEKTFDGGTKISIPIENQQLISGGSFTGLEILDTNFNDLATSAIYEWRQYYVSFGWSRSDFLKNRGSSTRVVDLVQMNTNNASKKMQANLTTGFFQSTKASSTDIDGFVVATHATGSTEAGSLTTTNVASWAPTRDTTTTTLSLGALNVNERGCSDGDDRITSWVTTDAIAGFFYDIATPQMRYESGEALKQGFGQVMTFNGKPFFTDKNATASHIFGLNENHLYLAVMEGENMRFEPARKPLNQASSIGQLFWMGNVVTDARRRLNVFTAITS